MASALEAGQTTDLDPNVLSKLWKIEHKYAVQTLDVTSQQCLRKDNPKLARNYGTNDRMLCYKHINKYFLWTLSLQQRNPKDQVEGTRAANFLSLIVVLFTLF